MECDEDAGGYVDRVEKKNEQKRRKSIDLGYDYDLVKEKKKDNNNKSEVSEIEVTDTLDAYQKYKGIKDKMRSIYKEMRLDTPQDEPDK